MSAAPQPDPGLPPGVSFEDAEKVAQGDQTAIAALAARFGANPILPLQSEFINFFAELPDIAWLALRQTMVAAKVPIRDIDKKVAAQRAKLARAAAKDPRREACFDVAVALKAQGATFAAVRKALLGHADPDVANWARDSNEETLRRLYDSASPEKLLPVGDFVALMPSQKFIYIPNGDLWPAASVDARVPPCCHAAITMRVRGLSRSEAERFAFEAIPDRPLERHPLQQHRPELGRSTWPSLLPTGVGARVAARSMLVRLARAMSRRGERSARPLGHCGRAIGMTDGNPTRSNRAEGLRQGVAIPPGPTTRRRRTQLD